MLNGDIYTIKASGDDIWNAADGGYFAYRQVTGDFVMTIRVLSIDGTNEWAKGGMMIRNTLDANSVFVDMIASNTAGNGVSLQYRSTKGGNAASYDQVSGVNSKPRSIRMVREGDTITGYVFADG